MVATLTMRARTPGDWRTADDGWMVRREANGRWAIYERTGIGWLGGASGFPTLRDARQYLDRLVFVIRPRQAAAGARGARHPLAPRHCSVRA